MTMFQAVLLVQEAPTWELLLFSLGKDRDCPAIDMIESQTDTLRPQTLSVLVLNLLLALPLVTLLSISKRPSYTLRLL